VSALNKTPSSTGPLDPLPPSQAQSCSASCSLGCCAAEHAKTTARPNSAAPVYLQNFVLDAARLAWVRYDDGLLYSSCPLLGYSAEPIT